MIELFDAVECPVLRILNANQQRNWKIVESLEIFGCLLDDCRNNGWFSYSNPGNTHSGTNRPKLVFSCAHVDGHVLHVHGKLLL